MNDINRLLDNGWDLSDLFSAAVKCRRKIFAEARKQGGEAKND